MSKVHIHYTDKQQMSAGLSALYMGQILRTTTQQRHAEPNEADNM